VKEVRSEGKMSGMATVPFEVELRSFGTSPCGGGGITGSWASRCVALGAENEGAENCVSTTKYTRFSYLPVSFALQFRRAGNAYFTFVVLLMVLGLYTDLFDTSITPWGQLFMLSFIFLINMLSEGVDDLSRWRSDKDTNSRRVVVIGHGDSGWQMATWGSLKRGTLVRLVKGDQVPADMLVLVTSHVHADPCVYVETSNIDGETYLKRVFTHKPLVDHLLGSEENRSDPTDEIVLDPFDFALRIRGAEIGYDAPSPSLSSFEGTLRMHEGSQVNFTAENMLFRGSEVRNVKWVVGIVLYTGRETKVLMGNTGPKKKQSKVDRSTNQIIVSVLLFLLFLIFLSEVLFYVGPWVRSEKLWYLMYTTESTGLIFPSWLGQMCLYLILYKNILPILLYAVQEGLSQIQAHYIKWDLNMYNEATDKTAMCNTSGLAQEIGQVDWIFTDKTGTLTRNEMRLTACAIGDRVYGCFNSYDLEYLDEETAGRPPGDVTRRAFDDLLMDVENLQVQKAEFLESVSCFFRALALCHTVLIDRELSPNVDIRAVRSIDGSAPASYDPSDLKNLPATKADSTVRIRKAYEPLEADSSIMLERSESSKTLQDTGDYGRVSDAVAYNAESPDEEALVTAAGALGYEFLTTEGQNIVCLMVKEFGCTQYVFEKWQVLAVNPFTSKRKRMSVIYREPRGERRIVLFCKGADNQMLAAMSRMGDEEFRRIDQQLLNFARAGMRTLVVGQKLLTEEEFQSWRDEFHDNAISNAGPERDDLMHEAACEIEKDLSFLGITCVEDRLQENVPETVSTLRSAGINLWVITGDKVETALNISKSVRLIDGRSTVEMLTSQDVLGRNVHSGSAGREGSDTESKRRDNQNLELIERKIEELIRKHQVAASQILMRGTFRKSFGNFIKSSFMDPSPRNASSAISLGANKNLALIVDGDVLNHFLGVSGREKVESKFLEIARKCGVVVACRASPAQKAKLVQLVSKGVFPRPTTLAIGDGTNDVPMIQEASVGVGISGREGTHAVNAADFSVSKFRFLSPLLFVHGRLGYIRIGKAILLVFYGNLMFTWTNFLGSCFLTMMSGTSIFSDLMLTMVNMFVAVPVFLLGLFDTDTIPVHNLVEMPEEYAIGPENRYLNRKVAAIYMLRGLGHGIITFLLIFYTFPEADFASLTALYFISLVFVLTFLQAKTASSFTIYFALGIVYNLAMGILIVSLINKAQLDVAIFFRLQAKQEWNILFAVIFLVAIADVIVPLSFIFFKKTMKKGYRTAKSSFSAEAMSRNVRRSLQTLREANHRESFNRFRRHGSSATSNKTGNERAPLDGKSLLDRVGEEELDMNSYSTDEIVQLQNVSTSTEEASDGNESYETTILEIEEGNDS